MNDGEVVIQVGMETKRFEMQIKEVEADLRTLEKVYEDTKNMKPYKGQGEDLKELALQIEKTSNKLVQLNKEQEKASKVNLKDINKQLKESDGKLNTILKKVGRWGLALFGIRSAYTLIRKAMSTLTQYNEQLQTDLNYITYAVSKALEPVIEYIIKLIYELLGLLNRISKLLFNYDLFASSGADQFSKANKNAQKLQKTLAGFDEVNIIGQNTVASGGAGRPSFDLSSDIGTEGLETLVDKIKLKFDETFNKIKINIKKALKEAFGLSDDTLKGLDDMLNGAQLAFDGLFDIIDGAMTLIIGAISGDPEKVKEGWQLMVDGIGEVMKGFILQAFGWKLTLLSIAEDLLTQIENSFGFVGTVIVTPIRNAINLLKTIFTGLKTSVGNVIDGIIKLFKGDLSGIKDIGIGIINALITAINTLINGINAIASPIRLLIIGIGKVLGKNWTLDNIKIPNISLIGQKAKASSGSGRHFYTGGVVMLDSGGLVNLPGRGVPVGNAITGERGVEGVIPLTNQQMMETLGQTIAKYISINATIPVNIGNRMVAKEIRKINAEDDFAFNR